MAMRSDCTPIFGLVVNPSRGLGPDGHSRTGSSSDNRPLTASPASRVFRCRSDRSRHQRMSLALRDADAHLSPSSCSGARRGLTVDPRLAIGDGARGCWKARPQVFGHTRTQRCWVHKTATVLKKRPKPQQANTTSDLHQIWMAQTREHAYRAFDAFVMAYEPKYPKAADCLAKDKKALLACYDFPAQHGHHIRTTNPIESTFAPVRLRTATTRGCVSRTSSLAMVFTLARSAEGRWLRLRGTELSAKLLQGVQFNNGVAVPKESRQEIAA
jgi:putative transposase